MTLPVDIPLITVIGTWLDWQGYPCAGKVVFSPTALTRTVDSASSVALMPMAQTAILDNAGSISISLPATNAPQLVIPSGFLYSVGVNLKTGPTAPISGQFLAPYSFQLTLPVGSSTVNISTAQYAVNGASVTLPGN